MRHKAKKDIQLSVRISTEDLNAISRAVAVLWPDAPITLSASVVALAKQRAEEILDGKTRDKG